MLVIIKPKYEWILKRVLTFKFNLLLFTSFNVKFSVHKKNILLEKGLIWAPLYLTDRTGIDFAIWHLTSRHTTIYKRDQSKKIIHMNEYFNAFIAIIYTHNIALFDFPIPEEHFLYHLYDTWECFLSTQRSVAASSSRKISASSASPSSEVSPLIS